MLPGAGPLAQARGQGAVLYQFWYAWRRLRKEDKDGARLRKFINGESGQVGLDLIIVLMLAAAILAVTFGDALQWPLWLRKLAIEVRMFG